MRARHETRIVIYAVICLGSCLFSFSFFTEHRFWRSWFNFLTFLFWYFGWFFCDFIFIWALFFCRKIFLFRFIITFINFACYFTLFVIFWLMNSLSILFIVSFLLILFNRFLGGNRIYFLFLLLIFFDNFFRNWNFLSSISFLWSLNWLLFRLIANFLSLIFCSLVWLWYRSHICLLFDFFLLFLIIHLFSLDFIGLLNTSFIFFCSDLINWFLLFFSSLDNIVRMVFNCITLSYCFGSLDFSPLSNFLYWMLQFFFSLHLLHLLINLLFIVSMFFNFFTSLCLLNL